MTNPRIEIDLNKLSKNVQTVKNLFDPKGIQFSAVTKAVSGSIEIANVFHDLGVHSLADSPIINIQKMRQAGLNSQYLLIRSPMLSEIEKVVEFADFSLNTELSVIDALSKQALKTGKAHKIILIIDLGDLREGILPNEIEWMVDKVLHLQGVRLVGIGTNLACFAGVAPTQEKMSELSLLAKDIQDKFDLQFELISGGNSANYQWIKKTNDLGGINHMRIGETILLGRDTLTRKPIPGLHTDVFTLIAEVIESKTKPSQPSGEIAQNAFGKTPSFDKLGDVHRALLAIGEQDVDTKSIMPRSKINILGGTSDHLVIHSEKIKIKVGEELKFDLNYSALLRAFTSPYVQKVFLK